MINNNMLLLQDSFEVALTWALYLENNISYIIFILTAIPRLFTNSYNLTGTAYRNEDTIYDVRCTICIRYTAVNLGANYVEYIGENLWAIDELNTF